MLSNGSPPLFRAVLAGLGLAVSGVHLYLTFRESEWADAILCLNLLTGFLLAVISISTQIDFCPVCIAFWLVQALLGVELILSERNMSRYCSASCVVGACLALVVTLSPNSKAFLASNLPFERNVVTGPLPGTKLELALKRDTMYLIIVTDCPPCFDLSFKKAVSLLQESRKEFEVFAVSTMRDRVKASTKSFSILTQEELDSLSVKTLAAPIVVKVKDRVVETVSPIANFRL